MSHSAEPIAFLADVFVAYLNAADRAELEEQRQTVLSAVPAPRLAQVFADVSRSGRFRRAVLNAAAEEARRAGAVLLIARFAPFARDLGFIDELEGVRFRALDDPLASEATWALMRRDAATTAAKAERIRSQLALKKAELQDLSEAERQALVQAGRPTRLGGAPISDEGRARSAASRRALAEARAALVLAEVEKLWRGGVRDNQAIAAHLNAQKLTRPRGGDWTGVHVSRVTARLR